MPSELPRCDQEERTSDSSNNETESVPQQQLCTLETNQAFWKCISNIKESIDSEVEVQFNISRNCLVMSGPSTRHTISIPASEIWNSNGQRKRLGMRVVTIPIFLCEWNAEGNTGLGSFSKNATVLYDIVSDSIAAKYGLQNGDIVTSDVCNRMIHFDVFTDLFNQSRSGFVKFSIMRYPSSQSTLNSCTTAASSNKSLNASNKTIDVSKRSTLNEKVAVKQTKDANSTVATKFNHTQTLDDMTKAEPSIGNRVVQSTGTKSDRRSSTTVTSVDIQAKHSSRSKSNNQVTTNNCSLVEKKSELEQSVSDAVMGDSLSSKTYDLVQKTKIDESSTSTSIGNKKQLSSESAITKEPFNIANTTSLSKEELKVNGASLTMSSIIESHAKQCQQITTTAPSAPAPNKMTQEVKKSDQTQQNTSINSKTNTNCGSVLTSDESKISDSSIAISGTLSKSIPQQQKAKEEEDQTSNLPNPCIGTQKRLREESQENVSTDPKRTKVEYVRPGMFHIVIYGTQFSKSRMIVDVIPTTKLKRIIRKVGNRWNLQTSSLCLINHSTRQKLTGETISSNNISPTDKYLELVSKDSISP